MTIPTPPHIPPPFIRRFAPLVLNHIDAWATTAVIVSLVLWQHTTPTTPLVHAVLLLAITATYWYGFALNDYYDAEHDSRAPHKAARNFFWPPARWKTHTLIVCGVAVGALLFAALAWHGPRGLFAAPVPLAVMWLYSAPPVRLKRRPLADVLTHAFFVQVFPYALCLYLVGAMWGAADRVLLAVFFLASLTSQLEQQSRDHATDTPDERNFVRCIGVAQAGVLVRALNMALCLILAAGVLGAGLPWQVLPFAALCLPLALHRLLRPLGAPRSERLARAVALATLCITAVLWAAL
jgi:1,4-dihydroxy-2-naphthoate octaprenyltransferase